MEVKYDIYIKKNQVPIHNDTQRVEEKTWQFIFKSTNIRIDELQLKGYTDPTLYRHCKCEEIPNQAKDYLI